ncbi:MAG: tetratricopeptide repeat protein [bacterium]
MNTKKNLFTSLLFLFLLFSFSRGFTQDAILQLYNHAKSLLPDSAIGAEPIANKVLMLALEQKGASDSMLSKSYHLLGVIHYYRSNFILSTKYFQRALETDHGKSDDKLKESCYNNLGVIYDKQERINEAFDAYTKSLKLAEKRSDSFSIMQSWINISLLQNKKGKYLEGVKLCDNVIDYSERHGDSLNLALGLQNRGIIYGAMGNLEEQFADNKRSLLIYQRLGDYFNGIFLLTNLADLEIDRGNFASAQQLITEATNIANQHEFNEQRIMIDIMAAQLHRNQGHYEVAQQLLKQAEAKAIQLGKDEELPGIYEEYMDLYARSGDHDSFSTVMKQYKKAMEAKNSLNQAEAFEQISVLYELDKTLGKNKDLMLEVKQKRQTLFMLLTFIAVLILTGAVIVFQYLRLRESTRALFDINISQLKQHETSSVLAAMPEEDVMIKEVHLLNSKERYYLMLKMIDREKLFLNPQISLQVLATRLGIPSKLVTQSISEHSGTNFSGLINGYRVDEAKRLLIENKDDLKMEEIASKAGFNNRVSFFNHFKELTGFTPSQFSKLALDKQLASRSRISSEQ